MWISFLPLTIFSKNKVEDNSKIKLFCLLDYENRIQKICDNHTMSAILTMNAGRALL